MQTYINKMKQEWGEVIKQTPLHIKSLSAKLSKEYAESLSESFYAIVLLDPETELFLTNEQVEKHLKMALVHWTRDVLSCSFEQVEKMVTILQQVREVHSRIGIPVQLVEMGERTLKKLIFTCISELDCNSADKMALCQYIIVSIDLAMEVMARVFSFSEKKANRDDENYRIFSFIEGAECLYA
jgi:diguanylate cyclase